MCERNGDFMLLTMMIGLISTYLPLDRVQFFRLLSTIRPMLCRLCTRSKGGNGTSLAGCGYISMGLIATINFCMAGRCCLIFMYLRSIAPPIAAQR